MTAVEVLSDQVKLMWVEPHDNNAPITRYLVMYAQAAEGEQVRSVSSTTVMAIITDLFSDTEYNFTVSAYNEIGDSDPSDSLTVRTLEKGKKLSQKSTLCIS